MSWFWQKKLLRYGLRYVLNRTGLLDDKVLDLENLDIRIGKQNIIELKDVGLNIKHITKLAQLPPCIRLETARVLSLRLTIPADFYQSSIIVEVDGVDLVLHLHEEDVSGKSSQPHTRQRNRSPIGTRAPQHRKTNKRISSPPPYDPGGLSDSDESLHIPTTQEVAKSFLREEPLQERRELEASVAANASNVEESYFSENSEGDDLGTGTSVGMPGFLAGFLQGVVDRLKVKVKNVQLRVETVVTGDGSQSIPLALQLKIGAIEVDRVHPAAETKPENKRTVTLEGISVSLMTETTVLADLSEIPSPSSRTSSKAQSRSPIRNDRSDGTNSQSTSFGQHSANFDIPGSASLATMEPTLPMPAPSQLSSQIEVSMASVDTDQSVGADNENSSEFARSADLDIRPGDDNISWGSRRSQTSGPAEDDLWRSMVSEEDLPKSLIIEPERAPTPRAHSSRSTSPLTSRQRRAVSPYDRSFGGPVSWPHGDQAFGEPVEDANAGLQSGLKQSQHSDAESMYDALATSTDATDNKRNALEQVYGSQTAPETPPEPEGPIDESMMESRFFSHEDAESIYMSAYSSPRRHVPGGWGSDRSSSPESVGQPGLDNFPSLDGVMASAERQGDASGHATPRAQSSPSKHPIATSDSHWMSKELLHVDSFCVSIPSSNTSSGQEAATEPEHTPQTAPRSRTGGVPGTFSAYSEMSSSRLRGAGAIYDEPNNLRSTLADYDHNLSPTQSEIDISVGTVRAQLDVSTGRLLYSFFAKVSSLLTPGASTDKPNKDESTTANSSGQATPIFAHINSLDLSLRAQIEPVLGGSPSNPDVFKICCTHATFKGSGDSSLRLQTFAVMLGGKDFLSLKHDDDPVSSQNLARDAPVLALNVTQRHTSNRRLVTEIDGRTAALHLQVDLAVIEDTFGSFGGLSGLLELSGSFLSESASNSPVTYKPPKGVRFAGESESASTEPELKFSGRVAGIVADLHGPQCSVRLKTTTTKAVYREQIAGVTVEHISLSGPYIAGSEKMATMAVDLTSLRVEYLLTPGEKDLERLISLLTPSKDRYDDDGDILIETLLRQRRKGSLLKAVLGGVKVKIGDWDCLSTLATLGSELSKLSAVTKYLPDDDKPGLLSLVRVTNGEARLPINERFGKLRLAVQDIHLAHVGLPPLLAFSIGSISASKVNDQTTLLHSLLPLAEAENTPAIMARKLGDEEDPTIKIKLFNLCAEYSVPVFLALTDSDGAKPEDVQEMAQSVADFAMGRAPPKLERSPQSDMSKAASKKTIVDLLIHDSAIGLTPRHLPSKALIVLSDAHISTKYPVDDTMSANVNLRKMSIYLTDGDSGDAVEQMLHRASTPEARVRNSLSRQGYVSVGTMMAAKISFVAKDIPESTSRTVEVDVKNELFILETCADSNFTLMATLGDLAPPAPPSTKPKYLLEPTSIEDMISSITGEAVSKSETQPPPQVLFDAEQAGKDSDAESDLPLDASIGPSLLGEEPDEALAESATARRLYGTASGLYGVEGDAQSTVDEDDYPGAAESLLEEDDPYEITIAPNVFLGDAALMRDLSRQCKRAANDQPIDFSLYQNQTRGNAVFTGGPQALGLQALSSPYRFNAPYITPWRQPDAKQLQDVPFRLRVRNFSVIWHLHDGFDWQRTRDKFTQAVERVEQKADERRARHRASRLEQDEEESVIGDFLFNSIYIGVPTSQDTQDLRRQINHNIDEEVSETASAPVSGMSRPTTYSASGQTRPKQRRRLKVGRSKGHKISIDLRGISADIVIYPPESGDMINSVDLRLKHFEIFDLVPTSTWRKFLTHLNGPTEREIGKPMFHIQLDNVKTLQSHAASEFLLHVSALPLRLHVDQDALDFITRFFEFKDESMMVPEQPDSEKPFIQRVEVETVDIRLDYKPKKVDYGGLRSGKATEFMNFVTLEGANIRLRHLIRYSVKGFDQLHPALNDIWSPDVTRNQLPRILAGLAPVRSLVDLGSNVKDIIAIPVREYKKDGRIVRSIQKGVFQAGKATGSELARLGAKVAMGTQTWLSNAEEVLSPSYAAGSSRQGVNRRVSGDGWLDVAYISDDEESERRPAVSAYANQPTGVLSGLKSAGRYLQHDLLTARDALIAVQGEVLESRGPGDIAGAVVRHAPTVLLRPVIGVTRAAGTTLLGVGNQIDRDNLRKMDDKYKHR